MVEDPSPIEVLQKTYGGLTSEHLPTIQHTRPSKVLDPQHEKHPVYVEIIKMQVLEGLYSLLLNHYTNADQYLNLSPQLSNLPPLTLLAATDPNDPFTLDFFERTKDLMHAIIKDIQGRWDERYHREHAGALIIGPAASGKSTLLKILQATNWCTWAADEKTLTHDQLFYRKAIEYSSPEHQYGSNSSEEKTFSALELFAVTKIGVGFQNDILYSILVQNGINPVSIGGIVQAVVSIAAYAGMHEIPDEWIWALQMCPFKPKHIIYPQAPFAQRYEWAMNDGNLGEGAIKRDAPFRVDALLRKFYLQLVDIGVLSNTAFIDATDSNYVVSLRDSGIDVIHKHQTEPNLVGLYNDINHYLPLNPVNILLFLDADVFRRTFENLNFVNKYCLRVAFSNLLERLQYTHKIIVSRIEISNPLSHSELHEIGYELNLDLLRFIEDQVKAIQGLSFLQY